MDSTERRRESRLWHETAMGFCDQAYRQPKHRRHADWSAAYNYESGAIEILKPNAESNQDDRLWLGILYQSAAAIALNCQYYDVVYELCTQARLYNPSYHTACRTAECELEAIKGRLREGSWLGRVALGVVWLVARIRFSVPQWRK